MCSVLVFGFLVAGLIVGCAGEEGGLDMPATVAPTASVAAVTAAPSATVRPIATATFTATPTAIRELNNTATPTSTATSSVIPTATNSPELTATEIGEAADVNYHSSPPPPSESGSPLCPTDISPARGGNPDCSEPTATPAPTATMTATALPTDTPSPTPRPTETAASIDPPTPSPTANPLGAIRFVDGEDCADGISRDLLPTMDLMLEYGDSSYPLVVEVADERHERQQGLMCREVVPFGTGMLFVFEESRELAFWMFNTYVSLEIVYLDEDRRAMRALRMEPCPRPEGNDIQDWRAHCSSVSIGYGSGGSARYALEVPAGWLGNIGIELERLEGVEFRW